jgi:beta-lactamase regulating signal transducer with metallopeptidase domain
MNSDIEEVCRRVISAMFDGGCRGLLVVAIVWAALKLFRSANASTRHAAWFATLLILTALPVVEFFNLRPEAAIIEASEPISPPQDDSFLPVSAIEIEQPLEDLPAVELQPVEAIAQPWKISIPQYFGMILVGGWLALAMVRMLGLLLQICSLNGITARALAAPADLKEICGAICREMGLRRRIRLLFSSEISAPMVVGFLNPQILIPQAIAGESRIEPVMRHEIAHIARWDDWANLIQQCVKAILFFHPGVLLASRRLTTEREVACDDHALEAVREPRDYALFLTEFAGRMKGRDFAAAPAAWSSKSQLKERIVMILDGKRNASPRLDRTRFGAMTAGALAIALVTLALGPRLAFAEAEKTTETDVATATTVETKVEPVVDVAPVSATVPAVATLPAPAAPANFVPVADAPRPPRPARIPGGGGDDIERRLDRLERMVESLMGGDKMKNKPDLRGPMAMQMPGPAPMPPGHFKNDFHYDFDFDHEKIAKKAAEDARREVDRARVEVERAKRDMERGRRDNEWARERADLERERADKQRDQADRQHDQAERQQRDQEKQISQDRRYLERERQALEEQRRSIEKRIQSIEKQMQKEQGNQNRNNDSNSNKQSDSNRDSGPKEKP